jgi:hypothetical protein|tara:strand:- start:1710 stop:2405 length:696 start_codon:yes stop_codon:yes gene_type:complete
MKLNKPLYKTTEDNIFILAPTPLYKRVYENDIITNRVYDLGMRVLDRDQKLMGQELPKQYDLDRQDNYEINYDRKDEWTENHELQPIGSRFYVPPNEFLKFENEDVDVINRRILGGFKELMATTKTPTITESWLQYYNPTDGRGHNAHNHNRWQHNEEKPTMYSGGYYLSDGEPIKDHPYSGVFAFHIRGSKHFIRPKTGMLLIWPHDIVHSVEPFYGKTHRAVINFNIQL